MRQLYSIDTVATVTECTAQQNDKHVPPVELPGKACKLGLFVEVLGHDFVSKPFLLQDDKPTSMRKPSDDIGKLLLGKNLHHLDVRK